MEGIDGSHLSFMEASTADLFTGVAGEIVKLVTAADSTIGQNLEEVVRVNNTWYLDLNTINGYLILIWTR